MNSNIVGLVTISLGIFTLAVAAMELLIACRKQIKLNPIPAGWIPKTKDIFIAVGVLSLSVIIGGIGVYLTKRLLMHLEKDSWPPALQNDSGSILPLLILYAAIVVVFILRRQSAHSRKPTLGE